MAKSSHLDRAVAKLLTEVEALKAITAKRGAVQGEHTKILAEHGEVLAHHTEMLEELQAGLKARHTSTTGMASAVTQASAQPSQYQSHERRLERPEAAVFPPKH
jgi:hypothetical protein